MLFLCLPASLEVINKKQWHCLDIELLHLFKSPMVLFEDSHYKSNASQTVS